MGGLVKICTSIHFNTTLRLHLSLTPLIIPDLFPLPYDLPPSVYPFTSSFQVPLFVSLLSFPLPHVLHPSLSPFSSLHLCPIVPLHCTTSPHSRLAYINTTLHPVTFPFFPSPLPHPRPPAWLTSVQPFISSPFPSFLPHVTSPCLAYIKQHTPHKV